MQTLDSIKNQLSTVSFLSNQQSVQIKGGEDKRDPRPGTKPTTPTGPR
ncbi:MAG: hypothetical protein RLZZ292_1865 [Bacteroidota bacterium]|jgi:hypothetical protein